MLVAARVSKLSKDAVRWLIRYNARRELGDMLGRELVGDLVDDRQLQAGLRDLLSTLKMDPTTIPGLGCIADDGTSKEKAPTKK